MTLQQFLLECWYMAFFPLDPPKFLHPPQPPYDGRFLAWVRARGTREKVTPVIIYDKNIGGRHEFVGDFHTLAPSEYGDDLDVLAERYPAPVLQEN